jgi:ABC-type branched-subunit amino acid transport system substrate-binding protein
MRQSPRHASVFVVALGAVFGGCAGEGGGGESSGEPLRGVDLEARVLRVGILNDLSGPAATIGRPIGLGFEMLYNQINAGGSGLLPDGWTVEWVSRDHGYNPQQSVQLYNEVRDDVLFLGMSFGTPTTLPLHPMLERDRMLAVSVSLSSRTGRNQFTPVVTPTYRTEAMRAVDWAVEQAGPSVKIGIAYQQDDFGEDALEGLEVEAEFHGVEVVSKQAIAPGQADFTAVVSALRSAGAEYVMLGILPGATGPLLGTAAQLGYQPIWMGNSPAWLDRFFEPEVIPPEVFANYHWVGSPPYWGEDVPGMAPFLEAYERFGSSEMEPDGYIIYGYLYASVGIEAFRRALEAGDVTAEGLMAALHRIDDWDINGLSQPISLATVPYDAGRLIRVLRPLMDQRTWEVVSDYAAPQSDAAGG